MVSPLERRHLAEPARHATRSAALSAEAGREHAVARRRGAAALDVPEHGDARLEAGALLDLRAESASPTPPSRSWPN